MYLYTVEVSEQANYTSPVETSEGILHWKELDWILDPNNYGIVSNISHFLPTLLSQQECYEYRCVYEQNELSEVTLTPIRSFLPLK
jgi:8-oxo-dGTP diphosphatase